MGAVRRLLILTIFTLTLGPLWAGGSLTLYLHELSVIRAPAYTLGDLATVVADDPALQATLASVPMGFLPRLPAFLSVSEIRRRIVEAFSGQADLIGSGTAVIPAGSVAPGREKLVAQLLAFLDREGGGKGRMEIELLSPLPEAVGEAAFSLSATRRVQGRLAGRTQVLVAGTGVLVWIHHYLPVARAARDLTRDQLLTSQDIEYVEADISALAGRFLTAGDLEGSFRVAAPIAQGAVLTSTSLERSYLVKAGDAVTVVFLRPGLSVSVPGRAYGSGARGDAVEVRPLDSKRRFWGLVSGSGEVVVEQL